MRTCGSCGFENAEEGKPCALCGGSEVLRSPFSDAATLELPADRRARDPAAAASSAEPALGQLVAGRYRVDGVLGRGGMGQVFRVHDLTEARDRALKILQSGPAEDSDRADRFKREIGILAKMTHLAIPRIHGWGQHEDRLFFVSDLVEGSDLKLEIQRRGPWPAREVAPLAATVAEALAAAHSLGIVHRDVKPSNIMLATDGSVCLLDFGLARGVGADIATLTRTGMIVGTPGYMSPEQFDGHGVDERTDIYSLGVVLFEMLTGRLPFSGQTPIAVALKHKTEPPPSPRSLVPETPVWIERITLRCLEKDTSARFPSAAELAAELRRPRREGRPQFARLPTGDAVLEDEGEVSDWALVLASPREKTGWSEGIALRYGERYYKLHEIVAPTPAAERWTYRFGFWPAGEIFRRLLDYEEDCAQRRAAPDRTFSSRLQKWMRGKGGEE